MKKLIKYLTKQLQLTVNEFAPYAVVNKEMGVTHFAWSYKAALQWLACYDAGNFGPSFVFGFTGRVVAAKG